MSTALQLEKVKLALNNLEVRKQELLDLKDDLAIQCYREVTGLHVGKKINLNGQDYEVVDFENLAWPRAICKNTVEGVDYTYKLTDWDLKSMGLPVYNDSMLEVSLVKPDVSVIMKEFKKTLSSESVVYKSDEDIAKALLNLISTKL